MNRSVQLVIAVSLPVLLLSLGSLVLLDRLEHPASKPEAAGAPRDTTVRVAVFNGCGRPGLAATFTEWLRGEGYDVVNGIGENADTLQVIHHFFRRQNFKASVGIQECEDDFSGGTVALFG